MINVTKVIIKKVEDEEKVSRNQLALATITIDYDLIIHNIRVMTGAKGIYLKFPMNDKGNPVAYPIVEEARQLILDKVIEEMEKNEWIDLKR